MGASLKIASTACALIAMSEPVFAQDRMNAIPREEAWDAAHENSVEAGVANLTVRAAFSPSSSLSRQELIGLLLLMSVPREPAHNPMQGAKP